MKRAVWLLLVFAALFTLSLAWPRIRGSLHGGAGPAASGPRAAALALTPPIPAGADDWFADLTAEAGIDFVHHLGDGDMDNLVESLGSGGCVLDFDGDGRMDLFLCDQGWQAGVSTGAPTGVGRDRLYRNLGAWSFADATGPAGLDAATPGFSLSASAADYDNDGDVDIVVCRLGANLLWENQGDGRFRERAEAAGLAGNGCSTGAAFFDADGDGLLDLYVGNYVVFDPDYKLYYTPQHFPGPLAYEADPDRFYRNLGGGRFQERTAEAGFRVEPGRAMGVSANDFDRDGDLDLFVANDATANFLFINDGKGAFRNEAAPRGAAYTVSGDSAGAMTGVAEDFNQDGALDLLVTDTAFGSLYLGEPGGQVFRDDIVGSGLAAACAQFVSWGASPADFDLDGDPDLLLVNGDLLYRTGREALLFENDGQGRFTDRSQAAGAYFRAKLPARACLPIDADDDGRKDALVTLVGDRPVLLASRVRDAGAWIGLDLDGRKSNVDGYGALITLVGPAGTIVRRHMPASGYLSQGDPRPLFGLGRAGRVASIEIAWPSGEKTVLREPSAGRYHRVVEGREVP